MATVAANGSAPAAPSRSASFQKMLELEKKYKLERLQSSPRPPVFYRPPLAPQQSLILAERPHQPFSPPQDHQQQLVQQEMVQYVPPQPQQHSSPPLELQQYHHQLQRHHYQYPQTDVDLEQQYQHQYQHQHQHQHQELQPQPEDEEMPLKKNQPEQQYAGRRSDPFTEDQNTMILKAVRRSAALPSLSISIPPAPSVAKAESANQNYGQEQYYVDEQESTAVTAKKKEEDEDTDSLCASPTWEGYTKAEKKKKEDKKQKKKEKDQAAKDAKVAKKRLTSRLSKAQSPAPVHRKLLRSSTEALGVMAEYPQDNSPGDAQSALAKLIGQPPPSSAKRPSSRGTRSFLGGVKLAETAEDTGKQVAVAREKAIEKNQAAVAKPRTFSLSPAGLPRLGRKTPSTPAKEKDVSRPPVTMHQFFRQNRSSTATTAEDASAAAAASTESRSAALKSHMNRSTPTLIPTASSQEARGRPGSSGGDSYVRSSRAQSTERALHGFKEEHKVSSFFSRLRSSSQPPRESRTKDVGASRPQSPDLPTARRPTSPMVAISPRIDENSIDDNVANWPPAPKVSSPIGSDRSSPRTFSRSQLNLAPPRAPGSPTFSFTSNMTSQFEHRPLGTRLADTPEPTAMEPTPEEDPTQYDNSVLQPPPPISAMNEASQSTGSVNAVGSGSQTSSESQPDSRTSERSSSSSYADSHEVSPPVSPVTTPDTSRPQSQKGDVSARSSDDQIHGADTSEDFGGVTLPIETAQDDSKSHTSSNKARESDDSWTRSAQPIDLDQQSMFTTSMSNLDLNDPRTSKTSLPQKPPMSSASSSTSVHYYDSQESFTAPTDKKDPRPQSQRSGSSKGVSFLPSLKHRPLGPPTPKTKAAPKPESRMFPVVNTPPNERSRSMSPAPSHVSKAETLKSEDSESSGPASYLQEARKSTQAPPPVTALKPFSRGVAKGSNLRQNSLTAQGASLDKPMAKMFVECCGCKFFHDMPSRLYECMVNPDSFVEDKRLGVSGAITTMVKCPWCGHNMNRDCCAGYMAMVLLQQRLH